MRTTVLLIVLIGFTTTVSSAQTCVPPSQNPSGFWPEECMIRLNQVGYYRYQSKLAAVVEQSGTTFTIVDESGGNVFDGILTSARNWAPSGESIRIADFSTLTTPGTYRMVLESGATSHPFRIEERVLQEVAVGAARGYYYQRASLELEETYAGQWARPAGHPDLFVFIHSSAATEHRPAGTTIEAPRGWYDAGDYNKYVVNSGISTYQMLVTYEHFTEYTEALNHNIPESGGPLPDILAEALWNLEWMLAMQDPNDGGVYHKLTNANFDPHIMPHQATSTRYVVQKSTAATLDFAATMAVASRIFHPFNPVLADSMEASALHAWQWARANPEVYYDQAAMNQNHTPQIQTGEYGDFNVSDEFAWAAMELYILTGADSLLAAVPDFISPGPAPTPGWQNVRTLGYYSLLFHRDQVGPEAQIETVEARLIQQANNLRSLTQTSPMHIPVDTWNFFWGSNGDIGNRGMLLMQAFRITQDSTYLDAARDAADYLLGRNATGHNFLTGFGSHSTMHPHHRPSMADGIGDPVPGLLAGGPNSGREDQGNCPAYPSHVPAKSYFDHDCSYASNEITINWNAPLVYLAVALEATLSPNGLPSTSTELPSTRRTITYIHYLYPNPAREEISLKIDTPVEDMISIEIIDVMGRSVVQFSGEQTASGRQILRIPVAGLASGTYFIRLLSTTHRETRPFTVIR